MKLLFKVGGTLLDEPAGRTAIARQLAAIARNHELVIVHGGGKQVTRFLQERGIASQFVNGLRVSDETVIDAVTQVVAGSVNKKLVSALIAEGASAIGLSGVDAQLTEAGAAQSGIAFCRQAAEIEWPAVEFAHYSRIPACRGVYCGRQLGDHLQRKRGSDGGLDRARLVRGKHCFLD